MKRRGFLRSIGIGAATVALAGSGSLFPPVSSAAEIARSAGGGQMRMRWFPYELKLKHAFNLARSQRTTTPGVQVEIEFNGLTGYGEASMPPYLGETVDSVCSFLEQVDLSRFSSPLEMEAIHGYLDSIAPGNCAAKAAVDIALHDLSGKLMGQPWHRIWGLDAGCCPATSFTIGIDSEEVVRRKVEEAAPYSVLKVKMGLDRDRETVEIIRRMRPGTPICVDVNQGWKSKEEALRMCCWLADRGCLFVEQPLDKHDLEGTGWLRERSPLPIIADEAVQRIAEVPALAEAYDGINIKLMKCGGLHEAYKMAVLAKALGMKVMLGCMTETSCAVTAMAQLAPLADYADLDGNLLISNDRFSGLTIVDGRISLPDSPGIGVTLL